MPYTSMYLCWSQDVKRENNGGGSCFYKSEEALGCFACQIELHMNDSLTVPAGFKSLHPIVKIVWIMCSPSQNRQYLLKPSALALCGTMDTVQ